MHDNVTGSGWLSPAALLSLVLRGRVVDLPQAVSLACLFSIVVGFCNLAWGQGSGWDPAHMRIEAVLVTLVNPPQDPLAADILKEKIRRTFEIYPSSRFDPFVVAAQLQKVRGLPEVAAADYDIAPGTTGGLVLTLEATIQAEITRPPAAAGGMLATGKATDFPILYSTVDSLLKLKLAGAPNVNINNYAWYARPDALLSGNPLVDGPPGKNVFGELSGYLETGLYGVMPIVHPVYVYAGASYMMTGSVGQDLFSDKSRFYGHIEDGYGGLVGGFSTERGDRIVVNFSGGRKQYMIGDGFLIGATSANGDNRTMINYSPRWAADNLILFQARYNNTILELFYLDPDELPVIDSKTVLHGINIESRLDWGFEIAGTYLRVPQSNFSYFAPTAVLRRKGLEVYDSRAAWEPAPGRSGPIVRGEVAMQRNENFPMRAFGFWAHMGWSFADVAWTPVLSYRYASLSGDDPGTKRFERWDPLLMGTSPWDWVQGMNHGKVFGNANKVSHRFQLEARPTKQLQLISQLWLFQADERNNLGGNPVLSVLRSKNIGSEVNLMGRYFFSKNVFWQTQGALTWPGDAINRALNDVRKPWLFLNSFVRFSY